MNTTGAGQSQGKWCILRTSAARTLPLVKSLNDKDIGAWSPGKTIERRRGHSRARYEVQLAIIPTFVFLPEAFCDDARRIIAMPSSPHPQFSLFTYRDAIPLILDKELTRLREEEEFHRTKVKKSKRYDFGNGDGVRVDDVESAFLGMSGVVESCNGKRAWVDFGGSLRVNIGAWKLLSDEVRAA